MKGKSHLAIAPCHAACLQGHSALFSTAVEAINSLAAAQAQYCLKAELKKFLSAMILVCDELGYLPIDRTGADLFFQIIRLSLRVPAGLGLSKCACS